MTMLKGTTIFRCGAHEHRVEVSHRDAHLLDGRYFLHPGPHRELFGLDFLSGLKPPPRGQTLRTYPARLLVAHLRNLLRALDDQADLIAYDYQYGFSSSPKQRHGGAQTLNVNGLNGHISVRPAGYCDLTLWDVAPNGRGRIVQMIDMRAKKEIMTDELGVLRVYRRKAEVGWFGTLPPLISWLEQHDDAEVEVLHA